MPLTTPIRLSSTTVSWLVPLVGLLALANTAHAQDITWTEDTNGDRVHDTTYTDANGDGNPETAKQDLDGNRVIESEFRDPADLGRWTEAWYDFDQNSVWDEYWVDWDGDGYFDQYTNFMSFSLSGEEPGVEPSFEYLPTRAYPTPTSPRPASESRGTSSDTSSGTSSGTTALEDAVWSVIEAAEAGSESGDSDHTTVAGTDDPPECGSEEEAMTYYQRPSDNFYFTADSLPDAEDRCGEWMVENAEPFDGPDDDDPDWKPVACPDCPDGSGGCEVKTLRGVAEALSDGQYRCPKATAEHPSMDIHWTCGPCEEGDCPDAPDADGGGDESDDTDDSELESSDADADADDAGPFIDFDGDKRFSDGDRRLSRTDEGYIADAAMVIPASAEIDCDEDIIFSSPGKITNRNPLDCEGSIAFAAGGAVKFKNGLEVATRGALIVDARSFRAEEGTISAGEVEVYVNRRITLNGATVTTDGDITLAGRNLKLEAATLWSDDGTVMLDADGPRQNLKDLITNHAELYTCASAEDGCAEPPIIRMARLDATSFEIDGFCPEDAVDIDLRGRHLAEYSCSVD